VSTDRDVERIVRSWMDEGVTQLPDRVLDAVLDQLPATPQRRVSWLARTFAVSTTTTRLALAAAVVAALVFGIRFLSTSTIGDNTEPTPTPSVAASPTVSPISRPNASWPLDAGTYSLPDFPLGVTFTVPSGWHTCSDSLVEQGVCLTQTDVLFETRLSFLIVENVVSDPCGLGDEPLDPPVGPSVDDLVTAISNLAGFEAGAPAVVTIDGYDGKQFTLTSPQDPGCDFKTWMTADRTNGIHAGEVNLLVVLDVNGTRLVIAGAYYPEHPGATAERAAMEKIMASVQISE